MFEIVSRSLNLSVRTRKRHISSISLSFNFGWWNVRHSPGRSGSVLYDYVVYLILWSCFWCVCVCTNLSCFHYWNLLPQIEIIHLLSHHLTTIVSSKRSITNRQPHQIRFHVFFFFKLFQRRPILNPQRMKNLIQFGYATREKFSAHTVRVNWDCFSYRRMHKFCIWTKMVNKTPKRRKQNNGNHRNVQKKRKNRNKVKIFVSKFPKQIKCARVLLLFHSLFISCSVIENV